MTKGITAAEAVKLLGRANLRPFTRTDWYGFAGCESKEPMIDYAVQADDGRICYVLVDDETVEVGFAQDDHVTSDEGIFSFRLTNKY